MSEQDYDPHYLKYFECFNQQRFFEAHEVLEALWLPQRQGPNGSFYKGLIQLAGAFVHWQKQRPGPAVALFKLARTYIQRYPAVHEGLSVEHVLLLTDEWLRQLMAVPPGPCSQHPRPRRDCGWDREFDGVRFSARKTSGETGGIIAGALPAKMRRPEAGLWSSSQITARWR